MPPMPILLIVPPELIQQWCSEIMQYSDTLQSLIYYGDGHGKIEHLHRLTKAHKIFNKSEGNE